MGKMHITSTNCVIEQDTITRWHESLKCYGCLYVHAMTGIGKTITAMALAEQFYHQYVCFSGEEDKILSTISNYLDNITQPIEPLLVIIDDMQWISDQSDQIWLRTLISNMIKRNADFHFILLSRANLPDYLNPLYLNKKLVVSEAQNLWLSKEQVSTLLKIEDLTDESGELEDEYLLNQCLEISQGYPIAVLSFFRQIKNGYRNFDDVRNHVRRELFEYYEQTLFDRWNPVNRDALTKLAVFDKFDVEKAECIIGPDAEMILNEIAATSSSLIIETPGVYSFHYFFLRFLRYRQQKQSDRDWKQEYLKAGECYEKCGDLNNALRCYHQAEATTKEAQLVVTLSEYANSEFARNSMMFIESIPQEVVSKMPRFVATKALLYSYQMKIDLSNQSLDQLKKMAEQEKRDKGNGEIMAIYLRTLVALPHDTNDDMFAKMRYLPRFVINHGFCFDNILPTGNMPSVINGGLDFVSWAKNDRLVYPVMKRAVEIVIGNEAIGLAEVCMGEILYEKDHKLKSLEYLTRGLHDASLNGSIRVQYAGNAIMARMLQFEGRGDKALEILMEFKNKVIRAGNYEILTNLEASLVNLHLHKGNVLPITKWLEDEAPDEFLPFIIMERYVLMIKARSYVSIGRYVESLVILNRLDEYAKLYNRTYLRIEVMILKAVIAYHRQSGWRELLFDAVSLAAENSLIRVIGEQGAAILPLWREIDWSQSSIKPAYLNKVTKLISEIAVMYPNYLQSEETKDLLTSREREVISKIADGHTNVNIAKQLNLSISTVKFHIANIFRKLEVDNRAMAVKVAKEQNLI